MPLYLDSDVVVKRYLDEGDGATAKMDAIFSSPESWGGLSSSEWLLAEVTAALAKKFRAGEIGRRQLDGVLAAFRAEIGIVVSAVELEPGSGAAAATLIDQHATVRFHAGDALHLHTAETLRRDLDPPEPIVFVTSDLGLSGIVARRGLPTFNPVTQPLSDLASALRS